MNATKRRHKVIFFIPGSLIRGSSLLVMTLGMVGCSKFIQFQNPFRPKPDYVATAIAPPRCQSFASPRLQISPPRRVLVVGTGLDGASRFRTASSQRLVNELATSMREFGLFEVIAPGGEQLQACPSNILRGRFDEREIATLSRRYNCDTICLVRVNDLQEHFPLRANVSIALVDAYETVVNLAIEGAWDTGYELTRRDFENFVLATVQRRGSELDIAPIEFQSPSYLLTFAGVELAEAIRVAIGAPSKY